VVQKLHQVRISGCLPWEWQKCWQQHEYQKKDSHDVNPLPLKYSFVLPSSEVFLVYGLREIAAKHPRDWRFRSDRTIALETKASVVNGRMYRSTMKLVNVSNTSHNCVEWLFWTPSPFGVKSLVCVWQHVKSKTLARKIVGANYGDLRHFTGTIRHLFNRSKALVEIRRLKGFTEIQRWRWAVVLQTDGNYRHRYHIFDGEGNSRLLFWADPGSLASNESFFRSCSSAIRRSRASLSSFQSSPEIQESKERSNCSASRNDVERYPYTALRVSVCALCGTLMFILGVWLNIYGIDRGPIYILMAGWLLVVAGAFLVFMLLIPLLAQWVLPSSDNNVPQKYSLTSINYWGTVIGIGRMQMANVLEKSKQAAIIGGLAEGSSIRSLERITGVHRDTIMRLGVRVGKGCQSLLDAKMRDLPCRHLQLDEIWGFIGKKERHLCHDDNPQLGDVWTFCAIDSDTKLVPSFKVGKRTSATANAFLSDIAGRMRNRVQISTDALPSYVSAVEQAFGTGVDYAQIVKVFESEAADAEVIGMNKTTYMGRPDMRLASTSHVERLNGTTRLHMRRLTRLTYAFSKKFENFEAAVGLHFAYYNFVKRHNTLRATPAMAAGIERDFWTVTDLVEAA
jgi:IS1 family transposase